MYYDIAEKHLLFCVVVSVFLIFLYVIINIFRGCSEVSEASSKFLKNSKFKKKRKCSSIHSDKNIYSYTGLKMGLDSSFLKNDLRKNYHRLPQEIIFMIDNIKVFGHFDEAILMELCYHMQTKTLLAGEHLSDSCDPNNNIIVVQSGKIELFMVKGDKSHSIKILEQGEAVYSLLNILEKFNRNSKSKYANESTIFVVAVQDSVVITLPIVGLYEVLKKHPNSLIDVVKIIGLRLHRVVLFTLKNIFGLTSEFLFENTYSEKFSRANWNNLLVPHQSSFQSSCLKKTLCYNCANKQTMQFSRFNICQTCLVKKSLLKFRKFLCLYQNFNIEEICLSADSIIVDQGKPFDKLYFLVYGKIRIEEKDEKNSNQHFLGFYNQNSLMGSLSLLTGELSMYTYRAVEESVMLAISKTDLFKSIERNPDIIVKLGANILNDLTKLVRQVDFCLDWLQLNAGKVLYNQGDISTRTFVVITGRLQSSSEVFSKSMLTGEYGKGELVGLAETLTQSKRGSCVIAVRDTELACISHGLITFIKLCFPDSITKLIQLLGQKILNSLSKKNNIFSMITSSPNVAEEMVSKKFSKISTVAILSISSTIKLSLFCEVLKYALNKTEKTLLLNSINVLNFLNASSFESIPNYFFTNWLSQQEDQNDIVLFQCDNQMTFWSKMCIRQADCILIIADAKENAFVRIIETNLTEMTSRARKYLLLLHDFDTLRPRNTVDWLKTRPWCSGHYHVRYHSEMFTSKNPIVSQYVTADFYRLARILTNKAIGLVLGGGAARGCAHVGVIKAMLEANIPIDMIGGTSIGSMIGAVWAAEMQYLRFFEIIKYWCKNKVGKMLFLAGDFTYPVTSFFTGKNFNNIIKETLDATINIEDLWLPYFCMTTDISCCQSRVHTFGSLWRYVRASMTLANYMPPLCDPEDGHLLLDGVYTNNLPADIMYQHMIGIKTIFAVDVGRVYSENFSKYGDSLSGWWVLLSRICPWMKRMNVPNIFEVQSKVGYIFSEKHLQDIKSSNFCEYLRPPIDCYGSLQFIKFDEIFLVGYKYAKVFFDQWKTRSSIPI